MTSRLLLLLTREQQNQWQTEAGRLFGHLHASRVEGLVSKLLLQGRHHGAGVQLPPVQEEAGMRSGVGDIPRNPFGLGVVRVAPRLVLPKKMHHLGVLTKPEMRATVVTSQGDVPLTAKWILADGCANKPTHPSSALWKYPTSERVGV